MLPMILESTLIPFVIQLYLCFKAKTPGKKWMPLLLVAVLDAACWWMLLSSGGADELTLPFLLAFLCLMWLVGIALAWGVYGIVKAVQKQKKNFGV